MNEISYKRHRFPPEIIQNAVWLYFRFTLSFRDVEDLLAERGLDVSYESIRYWVLKFGKQYARKELTEIVGDGCYQAAFWFGISSNPSINVMPSMTFGN